MHGARACEPIVKGAMRLTYCAGETVSKLMNCAWCVGVVELCTGLGGAGRAVAAFRVAR